MEILYYLLNFSTNLNYSKIKSLINFIKIRITSPCEHIALAPGKVLIGRAVKCNRKQNLPIPWAILDSIHGNSKKVGPWIYCASVSSLAAGSNSGNTSQEMIRRIRG